MLEGAERRTSMCQAFYRTFSIHERYIIPVSSNFPVPIGHNANFAWNQDEVPQNSRYAKRFYYSRQLSAQSGSCQTNQLRSSSLLLGTLSHGAHEPISVVLRTSFLDAPSTMRHFDDSRHSFAKIAIPYTILSLAQFISWLIQTSFSLHTHPFLQIINTSQKPSKLHLSTFTSFYAIIQSSI